MSAIEVKHTHPCRPLGSYTLTHVGHWGQTHSLMSATGVIYTLIHVGHWGHIHSLMSATEVKHTHSCRPLRSNTLTEVMSATESQTHSLMSATEVKHTHSCRPLRSNTLTHVGHWGQTHSLMSTTESNTLTHVGH